MPGEVQVNVFFSVDTGADIVRLPSTKINMERRSKKTVQLCVHTRFLKSYNLSGKLNIFYSQNVLTRTFILDIVMAARI